MAQTRCKIIAEIGVNHNGDLDLGRKLIDVAADAGADAVKFQTFFAEDLVTRSARKAAYQVANTGQDDSQFAMLKALELSEAQFAEMKAHCVKRGIEFMSTPFSEAAADLLERVPDPDAAQVERALGGVLCRCTGYRKIIDSMAEAGAALQPGA